MRTVVALSGKKAHVTNLRLSQYRARPWPPLTTMLRPNSSLIAACAADLLATDALLVPRTPSASQLRNFPHRPFSAPGLKSVKSDLTPLESAACTSTPTILWIVKEPSSSPIVSRAEVAKKEKPKEKPKQPIQTSSFGGLPGMVSRTKTGKKATDISLMTYAADESAEVQTGSRRDFSLGKCFALTIAA
jgi:hypothetical protein